MKSLFTTFYLLCFFPLLFFGQKNYPFGEKHAVSFNLQAFRTPAQQFDRNFSRDGLADQTSRPAPGSEARFVYHHFINENFKLGLGVLGGVYPVDMDILISKAFSGEKADLDYRHFPTNQYAVYFGLHTELAYFFRIGQRRFFAAGIGLNWIQFTPLTDFSTVVSVGDIGSTHRQLYRASYRMGEEPVFPAPEISMRFYQKFGKRWLLHLGGIGTYTDRKPITGDFTFFGAKENRIGRFTKRYAHFGADVGVTFFSGVQRPEKTKKPPRERPEFSDQQRLGLSLVYTFPPALSIQRNYPAGGEVDLTDFNSVGIEGRLDFSHRIGKKTGLYAGVSAGSYPHNYILHLTPDFGPFGRFGAVRVSGNASDYLALHLGGEYLINAGKKLFLSMGLGIGATYFFPVGPSNLGFPFINSSGGIQTIPETEFYVNPEKNWIFAPEASLQVYHRLGRRFLLNAGISGTYSKQHPIVAKRFAIKNDTQTFEGFYSKQFAHPALNIGCSMWLKRSRSKG